TDRPTRAPEGPASMSPEHIGRHTGRTALFYRGEASRPPAILADEIYFLSLVKSFFPLRISTPLLTSTPYGAPRVTASPTSSGVNPPARIILPYFFARNASSQSNETPLPPCRSGWKVSRRMARAGVCANSSRL